MLGAISEELAQQTGVFCVYAGNDAAGCYTDDAISKGCATTNREQMPFWWKIFLQKRRNLMLCLDKMLTEELVCTVLSSYR